ncbi:MAG TPA: metal ABC transporter ATP-binding protein [Nitrososphaeraceae archaeon]
MQHVASPIATIKDVTYSYNSNPSYFVLDSISFTVNEGDLLGIIGPNGAGKSTLFRCMLGLIQDYTGSITLFDYDVRKNKNILQKVGYISQTRSIEQNFPATVEEVVSLGIIGKRNGGSPSKNKDKISSAIEIVDLTEYKDKRIGELSGGQQQRVLIAKSIVNDPLLLILDEPTTSVDQQTQDKFYALIQKLNHDKKISIIWASHDLNAVHKLANKVACINRNMFFHGDTPEFFENQELLKMYSESAMQAHMQFHFSAKHNNNINSRESLNHHDI